MNEMAKTISDSPTFFKLCGKLSTSVKLAKTLQNKAEGR